MLRLSLFAILLLLASGVNAQGQLVFETPRHDFGTFTEGETVTHTFRFTNAGDAPLALSQVEASCGCTAPRWTSEPVAPGASGEVTVAFDSEGRSGPFEKTVMVATPEAGVVTLRILGEVTASYVSTGVEMGALTFDRERAEVLPVPGTPVQEVFRFQHTGDRPVRIASVTASGEGVRTVFPQRPIYPGDVMAVMAMIDEPARGQTTEVTLTLDTDDAAQPIKTLRLTATVE